MYIIIFIIVIGIFHVFQHPDKYPYIFKPAITCGDFNLTYMSLIFICIMLVMVVDNIFPLTR